MEKVIRDGKVAVLISPGYGSGWYTWNTESEVLLFSPKVVEMVEQGRAKEITEEWVEENLGITDVYCGGASDLKIEWLTVGSAFSVDDHDGYESILTVNDLPIIA